MLFNSFDFIIFALLVYAFYYVVSNDNTKKLFLLVASYSFYSFWDWRFTLLLVWSTLVDYYCGLLLDKQSDDKKRKKILFFSIANNLGILGFFKYYNFFVDSFLDFFEIFNVQLSFSSLEIILPVGISFYTFQTMSYTLDIYNNKLKSTNNLIDFSLFVSFFPQLVAGPIERASNMLPQIQNLKKPSLIQLKEGAILIFMGFVRKVLISDNISGWTDSYFLNSSQNDSIDAILGLILFSFQIYFDFSGYSSIARGLSKLLGIELMKNFNQPYFSINLSEFWKRWHISLSTWLRDYLYIPLGGNKNGLVRTYINLMITMLMGGLWHGASWNFVVWGGLHGIYLVIFKMFKRDNVKINNKIHFLFWGIFTYGLVLLTWLPFRSPDLKFTIDYATQLFSFSNYGGHGLEFIQLAFLFLVLFLIDLPAYIMKSHTFLLESKLSLRLIVLTVGIIGILLTMYINQGTVKPFIYFQF